MNDILKDIKIKFAELVETIEGFLFVETKDGQVVPFFLNEIQRLFVKWIETFTKEYPNRPLRVIILKGRQFGFSTFILAWFFVRCMLVPNTRAVVVSHEQVATMKLFRRVRFFANTLIIKPKLDKDSEKEYSFPRTNSTFYIGTAGTKAFGRGDNITHLHVSEVAFYENPGVLMNGLLQAVGQTGVVIIETTANGVGNYFYKLWKKSYRNPDSSWLTMFFKWTWFKEYRMKPDSGFRRTHEEQEMCNLHPELTNANLQWRRWKIGELEEEPGLSPDQVFMREYPLTPEEAFVVSGDMAFSIKALEVQKPLKPIRIDDLGTKIWVELNRFRVMTYMGIDVSEGLENHDRSVIDIYDHNLEQVAQWAGWCDTDELAEIALKLANRYNSYIVCEVNNMGIAVQNILRNRYSKQMQYHREVFDEASKKKMKRIGWRTSPSTTKPRLISDLGNNIREVNIQFNSFETIDECMSYIKNGKGGWGAVEGANDDRVIGAGLAVQGYLDKPPSLLKLTNEALEARQQEERNAIWRKSKKQQMKRRQHLKKQINS